VNLFFKFAIGFGIGLALSSFGIAAEKNEANIENLLRTELGKKFANAAIEFLPGSTFPSGRDDLALKQVRILSEAGTGTADYSALYSDGSSALGQVRFSTKVGTIAEKRT